MTSVMAGPVVEPSAFTACQNDGGSSYSYGCEADTWDAAGDGPGLRPVSQRRPATDRPGRGKPRHANVTRR